MIRLLRAQRVLALFVVSWLSMIQRVFAAFQVRRPLRRKFVGVDVVIAMVNTNT